MVACPNRPRVVVVEDYILIQENIRLVLERDCDVVATAEDSEAALAAVAEFNPDVVTVDVSLPGSSGFVLAKRLGEMWPAIHIIFVTAHDDKTYIESAFELGAKGYLLKSGLNSELPVAVREVTAGRRYLSPRVRSKVQLNLG
ncbi:MAG TPA: response regulator transcription factor [Bryobacteraceae bacterium]|nr:response regulator transcription factor [Bryobacteraceae bacterium]